MTLTWIYGAAMRSHTMFLIYFQGRLCKKCRHVFPTPASFRKHKKTCERLPGRAVHNQWKCKDCGKSFVSGKRYLEDHILAVHMGTSPYVCSVCSRGFASCNNYKRHMLVHTGAKPFQCQICLKTFNQYCNLIRHHTRVHAEASLPVSKSEV